MSRRAHHPWWRRVSTPALVSTVFVLAVAFVLNGYRHTLAPDVHVDELIYASVGQNLADGHGLTVQGQPFFWQPPLYFLVEWPIVRLAGLGHVNALDAALQLRLLNGFVGALTAAGIFALGWRLRGPWTAWAMAVLFLTDPFVIRVTRRLYIEPFAVLWILGALWLCWASAGRWNWKRRIAVGVLFGLAILSKELAAYALVIPVVLWLRRDMSWKEPLAIIAAAAATYLAYPLWALASGERSYFISLKRFQYEHLVGIFHFNGFNRPGVSFLQALADNAGDYWTSYVCIGLAVPATIWLWFRGDRTGRFLAAWSAASFAFLAAMAKFGSLEDQFFYFLMPPVLCVLGYAYAFNLPRIAAGLRDAWRAREPRSLVNAANLALVALVVALAVVRPNVQVWFTRFGSGQDHGFTDLVAAMDASVARGAIVDSPGGSSEELRLIYPDARYDFTRELDPAVLRARDIHWYVLRSKDVSLANGIDQRYYDYLVANARRVWSVDEHTFFEFGLYYVADPAHLPNYPYPLPPPKPNVPLPQPPHA